MSLFLPCSRCSFRFSKLGVIEGQLQFSFEKPSGVPQLIDHAQGCEDVLRNLDDLQEAVLDYQVCS